MLPYKDICLVSERHNVLNRDAQGRLHCDTGAAVAYPDQWSIYAIHGVRVPERVIVTPESYTAEEIIAIDNSEVARILAERLGWGVFLDKIGAVAIDTWTDPHTNLSYTLLDTNKRWSDRQPRFLRMQSPTLNDSTAPSYLEPVDPGLITAQAARKWKTLPWPANDQTGLVAHCNRDPHVTFEVEA
jgi:hypothetical protein